MKNIPLVTFFQRTWMLFLAFIATDWLAMTEEHFRWLGKWVHDPTLGGIWRPQTPMECFGPIIWIVPICFAVVIISLLSIHLYWRETIDADTHSGQVVIDWKACTPFQRVLIATIVRIGLIVALSVLCQNLARGETPQVDQSQRWETATVAPQKRMALDVELALYKRTQARYETIQNMRPNGVPAAILFCLHYREADNNFHSSLAQGDSLMHRSVNVPRGRIPDKEPPYTWEECAYDAVYVVEKPPLDKTDWKDGQASLDKLESYNGLWYARHGFPSPYLWAGTSLYKSGKFVRDGVFDQNAVDKQIGVCAILKYFGDHGVKLSFVED